MRRWYRQPAVSAPAFCLVFVSVLAIASSVLSVAAEQPGQALYLKECAVCHGRDGSGNTQLGKKMQVKDVHDTVRRVPEPKMADLVYYGWRKDMDAYGKQLTRDQIGDIVKYYVSLAK